MTEKQKQLAWAIAGATVLLLLPLAAIAARSWGLIEDPDHDLPGRLYGVAAGLIIAAYGNIAPRKLIRLDPDSPRFARKQAAMRFSGWVFVIAGLANAAIWAFVWPTDLAAPLSMVPLAGALLLVFLRCARLRMEKA